MIDLKLGLESILPKERIKMRYIDLVSYASDAGFYHLEPKAVVLPKDDNEIIKLFEFSKSIKLPLVFRTGGTSLSGQAITDGILVDLSQNWDKISIEEGGNKVRVLPGITGAMVNAHLKKYRRKIGPDPASISAAMVGGIVSNNSSGMCCGVKLNSYHTVAHLTFILPSGSKYSTEANNDYDRFLSENAELAYELISIKKEIETNQDLKSEIRRKYLTKNTVGYSINSFLDYEHPLDILAHLLIGGEGTLAFISEVVFNTVPDYEFKATSLLYFPTITDACEALVPLINSGAMMIELMDRAALKAVENMDAIPDIVKTLPSSAAAFLIEYQDDNQDSLNQKVNQFLSSSSELDLIASPQFTRDTIEMAFLWKVRKGLFPAVGAVRASGTTVILEDVAVPVPMLGNAIIDLQVLFSKYHYENAIIFGHAKDGNIHFVVTQSFNSAYEIERYDLFLREVVDLIVNKYKGTLKGEHGTGRNMAPFVETEWGGEAYAFMKRLKIAVDPSNLLNPGVIINADKETHLRNLKDLPTVEKEVDTCIECGYCEHKCPSRDLTTTPRRRIVVRRALKRLEKANNKKLYNELASQFQYDGLDTCAVDGLCATACPVDINTGDLIKRLRSENHSQFANKVALLISKNFDIMQGLARFAMKSGSFANKLFGRKFMSKTTGLVKNIIPAMPLWTDEIPLPPSLIALDTVLKIDTNITETIVYFPSCISRMMGSYKGKENNVMETLISICNKTNINIVVLDNVNKLCCGQIFSSKGHVDAFNHMANSVVESMWKTSDGGKHPIVIDVSSCAYTITQLKNGLSDVNNEKYKKLKVYDTVAFLNDMILPRALVKVKKSKIALHSVCALEKLKIEHKLVTVAKHFAHEVILPKNNGCCGMAGDRGFLFPELTASATKKEKEELANQSCDAYYSSTKTCEMAMSQDIGVDYHSILYLVDESI